MTFIVSVNSEILLKKKDIEKYGGINFPVTFHSFDEICNFSKTMKEKFRNNEVLVDFNLKRIYIGDQTWVD